MAQMKRVVPISILLTILVILTILFFRKGPAMQEQLGLKQAGNVTAEPTQAIEGYVSGENLSYNEESSQLMQSGESNQSQSAMEIDSAKNYQATLKTSAGDIVVALNAKATPITVNNFVTLAKKNFYNNTIFHRVLKGFMIQGGDPKGDGTGGPGYTFADEPFQGEYTRGTIAMANAGPNTNGSQFFIMHADYALPKNYVIFGKVTSGLEVVDKIAEAPVTMSRSGEPSTPITPVTVTSVTIEEN